MLHIVLDTGALGKNAEELRAEMDSGNPRVWVGSKGEDIITVAVHTLNEGDVEFLIERLHDVLGSR